MLGFLGVGVPLYWLAFEFVLRVGRILVNAAEKATRKARGIEDMKQGAVKVILLKQTIKALFEIQVAQKALLARIT